MGIAWSKEHYRVPKEECLSDIYGSDDSNLLDDVKVRYNKLIDAFKKQFSEPPQTIARSPGRVNLIGEHIDYEGYSVLPMAIGLDVVVAVKVVLEENEEKEANKAILSIANVNGETYTPKEFAFDHTQDVDVKSHHWTNYVLCGFKGIFDQLEKQNRLDEILESAFMKRVKNKHTIFAAVALMVPRVPMPRPRAFLTKVVRGITSRPSASAGTFRLSRRRSGT